MLKRIQTKFSALSRLLVLALAVMLLIPAVPAQAASKIPGNVTLSSVTTSGSNKVIVNWKKASNATQYRIYWKESGTKAWKTLANVSASKTSYTHTSDKKATLKGGKKYTYTVRAYNKYGKKWSSYDTKGKTVTIPAVPSVVKTRVKANNYKQVTITWTKSINATNYLVYYRSADTTKWTRIANVSAKALKYVHKSSDRYPVEAGRTYYYMVRGYNKTFKTYGSYNKAGMQVVIPEKPVATPTAVPTVEPTATPQPTQKPKPTATPKPTQKPTVTPKPTQKPKPTATPTPDPDSPSEVRKQIQEVIKYTNQVRIKHGSAPVVENEALDKGAAVRAKEIYTKFSHERPNGEDSSTAYYEAGAGNILLENIAATPDGGKDAVYLWEHSSGHLVALIDKDATHIGVGYYRGYYVQQFAKNPDEKYTLTVDGNGGVFPSKDGTNSFTIKVPAGADVSVSNIPKPQREGFKFDGWTEIDTYNIEYGVGKEIRMFEDLKLRANWSDLTPSVSAS